MSAEIVDTVVEFVGAINRHDLGGISRLLAPNHRFVDSLGSEIVGRDAVMAAWHNYFGIVPNYLITVHRRMHDGTEVALFGTAAGSSSAPGEAPQNWSIPFAAHARVESGLVSEWQVFADNEPLRSILR